MADEDVNKVTADALDDAGKENPFSFSKFMQRSSGGDHTEKRNLPAMNGDVEDKENPFSLSNFVQRTSKSKIARKLQIVNDEPSTISNGTKLHDLETDEDGDDDHEDEEHEEDRNSPQSGSFVLPSTSLVERQGDLNQRILELEADNENLRAELSSFKQEFLEYRSNANKRIGSLQKELVKARKKEVEETRALEDVVRMVEENLQTTTQRAVKAESLVSRLKEEIKYLKEGTVPRSSYDRLVQEHKHTINSIRERSRGAADLMRSAADKTAPQIRQLQNGVATLRFLADQFDDIGKVTDLPLNDSSDSDIL